MRANRSLVLGVALAALIAWSAAPLAGTVFRLEIGSPIAIANYKIKKAVLVVRPLACDDSGAVQMSAVAEGVVAGRRQSVAVKLVEVDRAKGIRAVQQQWPAGRWVLNLTAGCPGRAATASVVVPLGGPSGFFREKAVFLEGRASRSHVDAALHGSAAEQGR